MVIKEFKQSNKLFPELLRALEAAPKQLFINGQLPDLPMVAVIGSRKPTGYGEEVTYRLSYDLAKSGIAIVSGLAYGIDAIAHRAALDADGVTVAVLGCGLDRIYPAKHSQLSQRITENGGAIISEYSPGTPPLRQHFPARNRIISGLSLLTLVTEANESSGSLITANFALQQGRVVAAVPGPITSRRSAGPNNLLKSGALPITDAVDVLTALELELPERNRPPIKADSAEEQTVIECLRSGTASLEDLIDQSQLAPEKIATVLSLMEISGKAKSLGAGNWILTR